MASNLTSTSALRFGVFELDLKSRELRKSGALIPLPPQPFRILVLLASNVGQLVTREEIQREVWGTETFVDFEQGLNFAIRKIRASLSDDAEAPRYIETLPRRGYRFIAPVEGIGAVAAALPSSEPPFRVMESIGNGAAEPELLVPIPVFPPVVSSSLRWRWLAAVLASVGLFGAAIALNVAGLRVRLLRPPRPPHIESLAVLPFENLSHDPEQEYFADGMTEALITSLGKIGRLRVISRTSVIHYKDTHRTLPEIAHELHVDVVVEGAVLRSADRVRITAQLIEAATDHHLWAETYEGDLRDILVLQGEVARAIANEVTIKLSPQEETRLAHAHPVNPEANEAYLRARYEWSKWTKAGLEKSIGYFEQALQNDPAYAQAWAGLSDSYGLLGTFGIWPTQVAFPKAKATALKALQLDESLSEAHVSLGGHPSILDWNWSAAEKELQRAIALDPNNSMAHQWFGYHLMSRGRLDEAVAEMQRAQALDPLSGNKRNSLGVALDRAGRYDEALQQFLATPDPDENSERRHRRMAHIYEQKKMQKEAIAELLTALGFGGKKDLGSLVEQKYLSSGYLEAKKTFLKAEVRRNQRETTNRSLPALRIAAAYVALGEKNKAFEWLDKALQQGSVGLMYLKVDEQWEGIRTEPRFQDLLRRIGLSPS